MKKILIMLMTAVLCLNIAACGQDKTADSGRESSAQGDTSLSSDNRETVSNSKVLIAYFSVPEDIDTTDAVAGASIVVKDGEKMGNTEYIADIIQNTVGGDLFRIETVSDYPLEHDALVEQASNEKRDKDHYSVYYPWRQWGIQCGRDNFTVAARSITHRK